MSDTNPLALSDEEFLKMSFPEPSAPGGEGETETPPADNDNIEAQTETETPPAEVEAPADDGDAEGSKADGEAGTPNESGSDDDGTGAPDPLGEDKPKEEDKPEEAGDVPSDLGELQAFYKSIMAPFRANGRTIQVKDISEAVSLMQMGANYTWKMQAIQPHRKMLMMLENNGLLDEGKLSFLIDLDKRDPEAIKKLIKDSAIDVMDIDTESEPAYLPGSHQVNDKDVAFHDALEGLTSSDEGKETLRVINTTWDEQSKQVLWDHPEIMAVMQTQREAGFYATITAEVDRRIALGKIAPGTPFLQAYKTVGDELYAQPGTNSPSQPGTPAPVKLAEKVAVPVPKVSNGDKVGAAAPAKSSPKKQQPIINPLSMSDEEFLKHSKLVGRV